MAVIIKDKKEGYTSLLKEGCKIIEATIKKTFITYPHERLTNQQIIDEWFGTHLNRSHAYKDGSHVGGADELVTAKFLNLKDLNSPTSHMASNDDRKYPYFCIVKKTGLWFTPTQIDYDNEQVWRQTSQASDSGDWYSFNEVKFSRNPDFVDPCDRDEIV